jgi:hypothetical protein
LKERPAQKLLRIFLFLFTVLLACPIRYWPLGYYVDETWIFAINYARAHGLVIGKDIFWTTGPLAYVVFPLDIGNNLIHGLIFQAVLWCALIGVFADLFFHAGFRLFNLTLFVCLFALSAPLYWFNFMGAENLLLAAVLLLLVVFEWRGGFSRYVAALVFAGVIPLIKFTGGMLVAGALAGFLAHRLLRHRRRALREVAFAALIPAAVAVAGSLILMPASAPFLKYLRASIELARGYGEAMSLEGRPIEILAGLGALILIAGVLWSRTGGEHADRPFFALLLAAPLFISIKHGFVRQDIHVINFCCFAALALALIYLTSPSEGRGRPPVLSLPFFVMIWTIFIAPQGDLKTSSGLITGRTAARFAAGALDFGRLRKELQSAASDYPDNLLLEPEIRSVIGDSEVASLSVTYVNLAIAQLHLTIYPSVQRYAAYTLYLDGLNASWVREKGPRFLLFNGGSIDQRNTWAETPGMWTEIYRWYNTRLSGQRNLLFERRSEPRFKSLRPAGRSEALLSEEIRLPPSNYPLFWTLNWRPNLRRSFLQLFWRVPEVDIEVDVGSGSRKFRVLPNMLAEPVLGHLPSGMSELAMLFEAGSRGEQPGARLRFEGAGMNCYAPTADLEFFRPE